jgi:hypothetical protein
MAMLIAVILFGAAMSAPAPPPPTSGAQAFRPNADGVTFQFSTSRIEGTLRTDGAYHGVARLVDKRTGRQVIDPRYSALNLFKLMSANQAMGQPRQMERRTQVGPDWVEIAWPAVEGHKAAIAARYVLRPPAAIDLSIRIRAEGAYPAYELFLSSYFDKALHPHVWLKPRGGRAPELLVPTVNDVFRGTVLVFPRDSHSARHCLDGRWDRDERKTPVVQMCPVRHYAYCAAVQADPERRLGVAILSDPRCCYAISTRYHADADADRLTTYSAFDLSLFGADTVAGAELHARVRLAIVDLDEKWENVLAAYRQFLGEQEPAADASGEPGGPRP